MIFEGLLGEIWDEESEENDTLISDLNLNTVISKINDQSKSNDISGYFKKFPKTREAAEYRRKVTNCFLDERVFRMFSEYSVSIERVEYFERNSALKSERLIRLKWHADALAEYTAAMEKLSEGLRNISRVHSDDDYKSEELKGIHADFSIFDSLIEYISLQMESEKYKILSQNISELQKILNNSEILFSVQKNRILLNGEMPETDFYDMVREAFGVPGAFDEKNDQERAVHEGGKRKKGAKFDNTGDLSVFEKEMAKLFSRKNGVVRLLDALEDCSPDETLLSLGRDAGFYLGFHNFRKAAAKEGLHLCSAGHGEKLRIKGGYDFAMAAGMMYSNEKREIVANDLIQNDDEMFFVVTGANGGGKTTFARMIGQIIYFYKLGLMVPCEEAFIPDYDALLTHFSREESNEGSRGKLVEELTRLAPMLEEENVRESGFVILNELFTTAATKDAAMMGKKVLGHFADIGYMGIYVTHILELAKNDEEEDNNIVSLVAMLESDHKTRSYKIVRKPAAEGEYEESLITKYGMVYDDMVSMLKSEKKGSGKFNNNADDKKDFVIRKMEEINEAVEGDGGAVYFFKEAKKTYQFADDMIKDLNLKAITNNMAGPALEDIPDITHVITRPVEEINEIIKRQKLVETACKNHDTVKKLRDFFVSFCNKFETDIRDMRETTGKNLLKETVIGAHITALRTLVDGISNIDKILKDGAKFFDETPFSEFRDGFYNLVSEERIIKQRFLADNLDRFKTGGQITLRAGFGRGFHLDRMRVLSVKDQAGRIGKTIFKGLKGEVINDEEIFDSAVDDTNKVLLQVLEECVSYILMWQKIVYRLRRQIVFLNGCARLHELMNKLGMYSSYPTERVYDVGMTTDKKVSGLSGMEKFGMTADGKVSGLPAMEKFGAVTGEETSDLSADKDFDTAADEKVSGLSGVKGSVKRTIDADDYEIDGVYELPLALLTHNLPISNSLRKIPGYMIVTGANQGGKSTFLRSMGVAQVMCQAGMFVPAAKYELRIYNGIFTHFTRREDASMNMGKFEEELHRLRDIIKESGAKSLLLLNESFATTTEVTARQIAIDLAHACINVGTSLWMVTHITRFAKELYSEKENVLFLSAGRKEEDEVRYTMVEKPPGDTSYGMELYMEYVGRHTR